LSGQFFQRSLFAAVEEILGVIFASLTHRSVISQPKYRQIINCGLTILIVSLSGGWHPCVPLNARGSSDAQERVFSRRFLS